MSPESGSDSASDDLDLNTISSKNFLKKVTYHSTDIFHITNIIKKMLWRYTNYSIDFKNRLAMLAML